MSYEPVNGLAVAYNGGEMFVMLTNDTHEHGIRGTGWTVKKNRWYHLAVTFYNFSFKLYVDGCLFSDETDIWPRYDNFSAIIENSDVFKTAMFGFRNDAIYWVDVEANGIWTHKEHPAEINFSGYIDEVVMIDETISDAALWSLFQNGFQTPG